MNLSVLSVPVSANISRASRVLVSTVGILLLSASAFAQSNQGRILGTVRDESGGTIAGATVTVAGIAVAGIHAFNHFYE
jgi:hypothetical protein